jgi:hypothetical protein
MSQQNVRMRKEKSRICSFKDGPMMGVELAETNDHLGLGLRGEASSPRTLTL